MNVVRVLAVETNPKNYRPKVGTAMKQLFRMLTPHGLEVLISLSCMVLGEEGKAAMQLHWLSQNNVRKVLIPPLGPGIEGSRSGVSGWVQMVGSPSTGIVHNKVDGPEQKTESG